MTKDFRVSHSKLGTWRRCRQQYTYKYVEKLKKKRKSRPLQFGTMVHEMLECWINGDDPFELLDEMAKKQGKMFKSELEAYGDIVEDVRTIMTEYFAYHDEKSMMYLRRNGRGAEHKFEIELRDGIKLIGKIDAFGKTRNGLKWLVEHKSFTRMPNEDHRWRNIQSALYIRVNAILGWPSVDGTCWDYIRSKPPATPELLKSGKMSQRGIDTLPHRVLATLADRGLDPKEFDTLLKSAESNRSTYFQRIFNPVKRRVVDLLWDDMLETAEEMVMLHGKSSSRTIDRHCEWCDYEPLCRARLQGLDIDWIKEKEYYVDTKDHSQDWADAVTENG